MVGERHKKAQDLLDRIAGTPELLRRWKEDPLSLIREHGLGEHESHTEENSVAGAARHGMSREEAVRIHRQAFEDLKAHLGRIDPQAKP